MSIITDPSGTMFESKVNWRERPSIITERQWLSAENVNTIRTALIDLGQFCQLTGGLKITGSVDMLLPSGTIDIGNAAEMGVVVSGSGVSEYVGFVATNGSGSAIDATIQPNNSTVMISLAHAPTDGTGSTSFLQLTANNDFVNNGGPTVAGQIAGGHLRIYDAMNVVIIGAENTDVVEITGSVRLTAIMNLSHSANASPSVGDVWRSGTDLLYYDGTNTGKILTGSYP